MNRESEIRNINIDLIIPNRFQPRLVFDEKSLNELAESIKEHGIIQPLVVRKVSDKYEIIAGERRYKASIMAGLSEVPAIIVDIDDRKSAEVALVENVQRRNLNPIEEAKSYQKVIDKTNMTQDNLAQKIGVSQSTIANRLRLLNLSNEVQEALMNNKISERHARSLLQITDFSKQTELLKKVIDERLTVRDLDSLIEQEKNIANDQNEILIPKYNTDIENVSTSQMNNTDLNDSVFTNPNNIFNFNESNINIDEEKIIDNINTDDTEKLDLDSFNQNKGLDFFKIFSDKQDNVSLDDIKTNLDTGDNLSFNISEEAPIINSLEPTETIVKPIDENLPDEEIVKTKIKLNDLNSIKQAFDNLEKEIKDAGFKINREDFDFNDLYQIIIKIDK